MAKANKKKGLPAPATVRSILAVLPPDAPEAVITHARFLADRFHSTLHFLACVKDEPETRARLREAIAQGPETPALTLQRGNAAKIAAQIARQLDVDLILVDGVRQLRLSERAAWDAPCSTLLLRPVEHDSSPDFATVAALPFTTSRRGEVLALWATLLGWKKRGVLGRVTLANPPSGLPHPFADVVAPDPVPSANAARFAREANADLLMVAVPRRLSFLHRHLLRHPVERALQEAGCSVLLVRSATDTE